MRLVQTLGALPEYYDRGAANQTVNYMGSSLAPHTSTQRANYTVPSGRKAIVDSAFILITRENLATGIGRARLTVFYTPSGGSAIPIAVVQLDNNCRNHTVHKTFTGLGILYPGDTLSIYTMDDSTGGTCSYWATLKIFEFA
ncbi:MAG: hypothetical protein QXJ23_10180 [Thermofilum sp.]|uniref:hypothetical protein n=1 Tax=Thermofilum sp. TaxID=1961369 RepID=UPI00316C856E